MIFLLKGVQKIVSAFEAEKIDYMIVGGFAMSYYNRARQTADIDCVVQMWPNQIEQILEHFPDWKPFLPSFRENAERGVTFNLTDYETGVRYDFMLYKDSDYNWVAFQRRREVEFLGVKCFIASPEDLVISKLIWFNISKSERQASDIRFLIEEATLNRAYIDSWVLNLQLKKHGLF